MTAYIAMVLCAAEVIGIGEKGPNGVRLDKAPGRPGFSSLAALKLREASAVWILEASANPSFAEWFAGLEADSEQFMDYFVRCAFPRDMTVSYVGPPPASGPPGNRTWKGQIGLATPSRDRPMTDGERAWVSACLLAHASQTGKGPVISFRGAHAKLAAPAAERWTMGHPQEVVFGDLFAQPYAAFAMSLDLPPGYDPSLAGWLPPAAHLGRAAGLLDGSFHEQKRGCFDPAHCSDHAHPIERYLGRCQDRRVLGGKGSPWAPRACVGASDYGACRDAGFRLYRPVWVHEPHLANFEQLAPPDPKARIQAILVAGSAPGTGNGGCAIDSSTGYSPCVGRFDPTTADGSVCGYAPTSVPQAPSGNLAGLQRGQEVEAVLRAFEGEESGEMARAAYTAMVRYHSAQGSAGDVELVVRGESGEQVVVPAVWGPTKDGLGWLQVYPVYPGRDPASGQLTLRVRMRGLGDGQHAPELDAAGFWPGKPWCCLGDAAMDWCATAGPSTPVAHVCE